MSISHIAGLSLSGLSHIAGLAKSGLANIAGQSIAPGYTHLWNGEYSGDTDVEYLAGGSSTQQGTVLGGATIDTWTNHGVSGPTGGGTYGLKIDADDECLRHDGSAVATDAGTVALDVYGNWQSANTYVFTVVNAGNVEFFRGDVRADGSLRIAYYGSNATLYDYNPTTYVVADNTWTRVRFAWSVAAGELAVKVGANAWESASRAIADFTAAPIYKYIGDGVYGVGVGVTCYIDNVAFSDSYQDEGI